MLLAKMTRGTRGAFLRMKQTLNQHSPLHQYIGEDASKLRSELFGSKKIIPGRKLKALIGASFLGMILLVAKKREVSGYFKMRKLEQRKDARKILPVLQACEDLRYLALQDKHEIMMDAVFEHKSKQFVEGLKRRYHSERTWYLHPEIYP